MSKVFTFFISTAFVMASSSCQANTETHSTSQRTKDTKREEGMHQVKATVRFLQHEGGFYGAVGSDGRHWLIDNLPKHMRQDGLVIKFIPEELKGMMTLQQWGKLVKAHDLKVVSKPESARSK